MKKLIAVSLAVVMVLTLAGTAMASQDETGNGAPSGSHVTLNIIGVQNPKTQPMIYPSDDPSGRSSIFVKLEGKTRIYLHDGGPVTEEGDFKDLFGVIDANGTDGRAEFQLANPGLDPYVIGGDMTDVDTIADYKIVVRPLGKPEGSATMVTCAELLTSDFAGLLPAEFAKEVKNAIDPDTGAYISMQQVPAEFTFRDKGRSTFEDVTAYLLTIVFEVDLIVDGVVVDTVLVRVPIFDSMLQNEYWLYDNNGLKLLQVRFYPIPTNITYADAPFLP